jgi:hypothetical protein
MREWLPRLVGIERALAAAVRQSVTPAVHQVEAFAGPGEVAVVSVHPEYRERTALPKSDREESLGDLRGTTKPLPIG